MKNFLKTTLAVFVALILFTIISGIVSVSMLGAIASMGSSETALQDNSLFKIDLSGLLAERVNENDLEYLLAQTSGKPTPMGLNDLRSSLRKAATSDQIKELYHRYDEEMKLIATKNLTTIEDDDIDRFVKYRNDITHGSYRVLDRKIAVTTHFLSCLVYCCVLTRVGVSREDIKRWIHDGRLLR